MHGFIDLHCHWIAGIDDGVRDKTEALSLLRALQAVGFSTVMASPHMRPGMFDNTRADLVQAYEGMLPEAEQLGLTLGLGSEHFLDDQVFGRILQGEGLPFPGGKALLIELGDPLPRALSLQLARLVRAGLTPIVAHPERYPAVWTKPELVEEWHDLGVAAQLDLGSLMGKYGRKSRRSAEFLLERGAYHVAGSDAHRPGDVSTVGEALEALEQRYGATELELLLVEGPRALLQGQLP